MTYLHWLLLVLMILIGVAAVILIPEYRDAQYGELQWKDRLCDGRPHYSEHLPLQTQSDLNDACDSTVQIPVPSSLLLFGLGLGALSLSRRPKAVV